MKDKNKAPVFFVAEELVAGNTKRFGRLIGSQLGGKDHEKDRVCYQTGEIERIS